MSSIYIETTIVSYLTCKPSRNVLRKSHEIITRRWWQSRRIDFDLFTSTFVINEASKGDSEAAAKRLKALAGVPLLPVTDQSIQLADRLARELKLPLRARADAAHIAVSAVHGIDFLLTWNCRHLANGELIDRIERSCAAEKVVAPRILTPELLMELP